MKEELDNIKEQLTKEMGIQEPLINKKRNAKTDKMISKKLKVNFSLF